MLESPMSQLISMLQSKTCNLPNKKDREVRPILRIKDIATTTVEVVLDQEVAVVQVALLSEVHLAAESVVGSNNTKILQTITRMLANQEETQVVRGLRQVELHRRLQERILRLNMPVAKIL
jgi:hypothetical protein